MLKSSKQIPPVIKWSGSKRSVASNLGRLIPKSNRYFEPFVGGGSMLPFRKISTGFASDIIPELISLWKSIKNEPVKTANEYQIRWDRLQKEGYQVYYEIRDNFNKYKNEHDFLFLTRTCVNGLIRYNDKGEFNNSYHLTRPGINPQRLGEIINQWNFLIKNIEFKNSDYRDILQYVYKNDFVFLDPPYGGTKGRYKKAKFELNEFFKQLDKLNSIDAKWILTFDGMAGDREYFFELPKEIYKHKLHVKTGNSPFTKMMQTTIDAVHESVYLNFDPASELLAEFTNQVRQELTLFSSFEMQNCSF